MTQIPHFNRNGLLKQPPLNFKAFRNTWIALAVIGILSIASSFFTSASLCVFYRLVKIPCPSCGMSHAFSALFTASPLDAFLWHPLFWMVPGIPFLLLFQTRYPRAVKWIPFVLVGSLLLTWVVRVWFPILGLLPTDSLFFSYYR